MTAPVSVSVQRLPHASGLDLPAYKTDGAAGADLLAAVPQDSPVSLLPMARALIPTGLAVAIPDGFEIQIRPRSGLAKDAGVTVLNSPGTIDSDYRGEIQVLLINLGGEPVTIRRGERIAQMVLAPVTRLVWTEIKDLPPTARGEGGFGSTGRR
ncbi:MAG: dUTP diphosphatase [Alphaproteobacteria bacterium]